MAASKSILKPLLIALTLLTAAAGGGGYWWTQVHPYESTDNAYLKAHITLISPKLSGYVSEVRFQDNQAVQPGDVLVVLDDSDFRARVAQAEAEVQAGAARIATLETDKQAQLAQVREEEANQAAARAELERADKDWQRLASLARDGAVSMQSHDASIAARKQAQALLDKNTSAWQQEYSQLAVLDAQSVEARARLAAAEAALALARHDLQHTRIIAPAAGIIGNRSVEVGQWLRPGITLAALVPSAGVFVEANFKETQLEHMQPGQAVQLRVDAYPSLALQGRVDSSAPAAGSEFSLLPPENATGNFTKIVRRVPVKIVFAPDTDLSPLKPGLSVLVKVRVR